MPPHPRFDRVAALQRGFVGRETELAVFDEELAAINERPRVLNLTGVGGIGKSRLLTEFENRVAGTYRTGMLDLQMPSHRQQEDALAVLRNQLSRQGARFKRYDLAYEILWRRLHPNVRLGRTDPLIVAQSEILGQFLSDSRQLPYVGPAVRLIWMLEQAAAGARRKRRKRIDDILRALDSLPVADVVDAVTYLFAEDLRASSNTRPFVVFVDAYEVLGRAPGLAQDDRWLRDLVGQLSGGLVVIAGREPLGWSTRNSDWTGVVRTLVIGGLAEPARIELLAGNGVSDPRAQRSIAAASEGVPFYLHLALDTVSHAGSEFAAVSAEEILQRFLEHVRVDEVQILELLSVARIFDFEIFRSVAVEHQLPEDRATWESLRSYSFVVPVAGDNVELHQLMAQLLRQRVSRAATGEVHRLLRAVWDRRAGAARESGARRAELLMALRESAFHALRTGALDGDELIAYADQIRDCGGTHGLNNLLVDVRRYLDEGIGGHDIPYAVQCIEAEAAILLGDISRAAELAPHERWRPDFVGVRLTLVGAHARRIADRTTAALAIYTTVWNIGEGPTRLTAGMWAADMYMAQGMFVRARESVLDVRAVCPEGERSLQGDLARVLHHSARFQFAFDEAERHLTDAVELYQAVGNEVGLAAAQTDLAELLAWTDPAAAVDEAATAIRLNQELGIPREVGKSYTALSMALACLGRLDEAEQALQAATDVLASAGYPSGRARAALLRGVIQARQGRLDAAAESERWAINELVDGEVYPTLVLMAATILAVIDRSDRAVAWQADMARARIHAEAPLETIEERIGTLVDSLLGRAS
ncbi:ATP-binding protein [Nocardia colli]|uniref:ATP-binding protein n=1 Tax=Nocardia colli TaxID=2545717 RepID=A0A5N0DMQ8_9NOCA|nr:ATP-binding protein [Nocardia colli]KAA8877209.1 ATP-binding protein [Nocardia colli]